MFSYRVALTLAMLLLVISATSVLAADPTPLPTGLFIDPLDPRAGSGANRVGAPLVALIAVVAIGAVTAAATALVVRVSRVSKRRSETKRR